MAWLCCCPAVLPACLALSLSRFIILTQVVMARLAHRAMWHAAPPDVHIDCTGDRPASLRQGLFSFGTLDHMQCSWDGSGQRGPWGPPVPRSQYCRHHMGLKYIEGSITCAGVASPGNTVYYICAMYRANTSWRSACPTTRCVDTKAGFHQTMLQLILKSYAVSLVAWSYMCFELHLCA